MSPQTHARIYRCLDGLQSCLHPQRQRFRQTLLEIIEASHRDWPSADYGAGYLYQSSPRLGLRGFRHTDARLRSMAIGAELAGRRVLEIGCNSGFLSLELAAGTQRLLGFDNNPFLIRIAVLAQAELSGMGQVEFRVDTVEAFASDERFDVVLSFANHSTWDGNMTLPLQAYFAKLQTLLLPAGVLYFESHHPALESRQQLAQTLQVLGEYFAIESQRELSEGSAWDRGRCFVKARSLRVA